MNRDRWQLVAMMRRSGATYASMAIDLDMPVREIMRACKHYGLNGHGYAVPWNNDGPDMYSDVPWHVRLTDRGHSQAILIQGGQG